MKNNKWMLALTVSCFALPVLAQETQSSLSNKVLIEVTSEVSGQPSDIDVVQVKDEVDTSDVIEQKMADYVRKIKSSLVTTGKQHSVFIYSGSAEIAVDRHDPRWTEYRAAALDKAVLAAQKSYLQTLNTDVENNVLYSRTSLSGLPTPTKEDFLNENKMASFLDKVVAVLEGKLDSELKAMGIDPRKFETAPPSIKRDLFKESVVKEAVRTSYGDLAGMMVIKVYEEIRDSGQGTVGVVMALSAEKREQVRAMVDSKGQIAPIKAKANPKFTSVYEMLYAQSESLYLKVGTQVMYDHQGYPLLLSYGQSGVTYAQSAQRRNLERQTAQIFATNNAWSSLAQTYNLSGDFRSATSEENQVSETEQFDLMAEGVRSKSSGITNNLIKKIAESAAMTSSVQGMTGVSVEYEWRRKHPVIGHEMVGSVLVWHPKTIQNAVNMASGKSAETLEIEADLGLDGPAGNMNSAESENMFDSADF
ncbi:DUF6844 domain-containing protein [Vibrio misgurnus]|uniref:DUF6844 domain-containing protein n=1 Tax=Vibrio misgurnus TaxID=2993714 RepID=UPI0023F722B6|nr:hypothetical protein [Vibrio sp. VCS]